MSAMFPFVAGDSFRRRRRREKYARDDMPPPGPLAEVLALWMLITAGGMLAALAFGGMYLMLVLRYPLGRFAGLVIVLMLVLSVACFWLTYVFWHRLTR